PRSRGRRRRRRRRSCRASRLGRSSLDTDYTGVGMAEANDFRFGLGHPVLEFVATLAGRHSEPIERLAAPEELSRWLELTRIAPGARCDRGVLAEARELREALYRIVVAARQGESADTADIDLVNAWARRPTPSPQLDPSLSVTVVGPDPCRAALAQLARDAVGLLAGDDLVRIRN